MKETVGMLRQLQSKTLNQEHKEDKTKHSTRNINTANPKQTNN
jgi:hypothetical protein